MRCSNPVDCDPAVSLECIMMGKPIGAASSNVAVTMLTACDNVCVAELGM